MRTGYLFRHVGADGIGVNHGPPANLYDGQLAALGQAAHGPRGHVTELAGGFVEGPKQSHDLVNWTGFASARR